MNEKVSVIMGVYNCQDTLEEAIESIINQTYKNWELIMCDDASTDNTWDIATRYAEAMPEQIKVLRNHINKGLNYTLNKCLKEAEGEFVARMDGDDISYPERFELEVSLLNKNKDIHIVSSDMEFFDGNGIWGRTYVEKTPTNKSFLNSTPFCHAACMVRKEAYLAVKGYSVSKKLLRVEDYHLWIKMYEKGFRGINIQRPLYQMRDDRNAQGRRKFRYRLNESYVKAYAIKHLQLPVLGYLYCLRPILVGILPSRLYKVLHRKKQSGVK